jgi:peptide/nickel transport system substrate-binding protein
MTVIAHRSTACRLTRTVLALGGAVACGPTDRPGTAGADVGGTIVISAPSEAEVLVPPLVYSTAAKQVVDQMFDALAEIPSNLNTLGDAGWSPALAESWTWSADSLAITFRLNPRARFHDGRPVRASDVRFSVGLYKDPAVAAYDASNFESVDSVTVADSLSATFWYHERSPQQFFQVAYYLRVLPEHHLREADRSTLAQSEFARRPIGSGPFRFMRWVPRATIELVADTGHYRGRPHLDRVIWSLQTDATAGITSLLAGESDFRENVPLDALARVAEARDVRAVRYRGLNYGFLAFNLRARGNDRQAHPLFRSRELRRALAMALDRHGVVRNALDSTGRVNLGPFPLSLPAADSSLPQIPYDTAGSSGLLDSLGWHDRDGDGVREKGGIVLRFGLAVPTSSPHRRRFAVLIQEQLRRVGAQVDVEELDPSALGATLDKGRFDTYIHFVQSSPAPSGLADGWSKPDAGMGRFRNPAYYASPAVDALVDSALMERDATRSVALYRRAYRRVAEDAPAVWLYEAVPYAAAHQRLRFDLDRADVWWRDLRLWWIPSGERIDRDRVGLVSPRQ